MKRLWYLGPGNVVWREAEDPRITHPDDAIVRPIASTTCDLDVMILKGTTPFQGPIAFGHEGIGEIVALGDGAAGGLHLGQKVVLPWHLSCGACDRCHSARPSTCRAYPPGAMYGLEVNGEYGSFFSDLVKIPHARAVLTPLPPGLDPVVCASAGDNLPFGYEMTVPHLAEAPGADVLVIGGGSIGLYAVAFAKAAGAREVVYVDADPDRLERAGRLGATLAEGPPPRRMPRNFTITVDASAQAGGLRCAILSTEPEGVCSSMGGHWSDVPFPVREMYTKGIHFHTGRGMGLPNITRALDFVVAGRVDPNVIVTEVVPFDDGDRALADPSMKIVLTRD